MTIPGRAGRPEQPAAWRAPRYKVVTWYDQAATVAGGAGLSGLEFMRALMDGKITPPPIALLLNMSPAKVDQGLVVFECAPDESVYNPIGLVHGGLVCTLADSVAGCAVQTTLAPGAGYTSIDIAVNYLRPVTLASGTLVATGRVIKPGRRVALASAEITDDAGRLVATATSNCLILPPPGRSAVNSPASQETSMSVTSDTESGIRIPGTSSHFLDPPGLGDPRQGRLRYLTGGTGAPLVMLHTVRTQAEHFRLLIPLVQEHYTVYALDLPGMGYSQIVPGAPYNEPAMRADVKRLITQLDLRDATLLGESMGAVLALTTAADLPERVRRVVAVNPYDYPGGILRSSLLARLIIGGVIAPGVGPFLARQEPKPVMRAVLRGGLGDKTALRADYLDELLRVGRRPGYPVVARAVYANLPSLIAARSRYREVSAPVHLIYGEKDWSRPSDRQANRQLLPTAGFTQVPDAGHFIALERPDVPASVLNPAA